MGHGGCSSGQEPSGLAAAAERLRQDEAYRSLVRETGERYLSDGPALVHGDYFPGSWLRTVAGIRVIDPEFCFYGDPEFDVGCAVAHLALAAQPRADAGALVAAYGTGATLRMELAARYAAVEVMRRLIGVAQLPLSSEHVNRCGLLERSRKALLGRSWEMLWV